MSENWYVRGVFSRPDSMLRTNSTPLAKRILNRFPKSETIGFNEDYYYYEIEEGRLTYCSFKSSLLLDKTLISFEVFEEKILNNIAVIEDDNTILWDLIKNITTK